MSLAWVIGLCAVAMAFQTTKDTKGTKETKGPSTPAQSASTPTPPAGAGGDPGARDDKSKANPDSPQARNDNNTKGIAPRLAPLARGDRSRRAARDDKSTEAQAGRPVPQQNMAASRVQHTYVQTIHAPADRVFAVIEPVAEVEWAPGFEYTWVYAHDGAQAKAGQEGDVFLTQHHSGLGSKGTAIWVISRRDFTQRRIQFVRVIPAYQVTQIDVHVMPDGKQSKCEVTYTYTALSEHGRQQLQHITREHYEAQMKEWEEQVNAYLSRR